MKRALCLPVALACAAALGACAHPVERPRIRSVVYKSDQWPKGCTLEMADAEVVAGAPVRLRFSLFNHDFEHSLPYGMYIGMFTVVDTPFRGLAADLFAVERDGEPVPYRGPVAKTPDFDKCPTASGCVLGEDDYLRIRKEEKLTVEVDLGAAYAFDRPGTYTIRYKVRLHDLRFPRFNPLRVFTKPDGLRPHKQELSPHRIGCNTVTVKVRPR